MPGGRNPWHALAGHRHPREKDSRAAADAGRKTLSTQRPRVADRSTPRLTGTNLGSLEVEDGRAWDHSSHRRVLAEEDGPISEGQPSSSSIQPLHRPQGTCQGVGELRVAQDDPVPMHAPHLRIAMGHERRQTGDARQNYGPFVHVHDLALCSLGPGLFRSQGFRHGFGGSFQTSSGCAISSRRSRYTWAENRQNAARRRDGTTSLSTRN